MEIKDKIIWDKQDKFFGLDYSTKKGTFQNLTFDIRYDSDADRNIKPKNCGCCLVIYIENAKLYFAFGSIEELTKISQEYTNGILNTKLIKYNG